MLKADFCRELDLEHCIRRERAPNSSKHRAIPNGPVQIRVLQLCWQERTVRVCGSFNAVAPVTYAEKDHPHRGTR
jgi:hypothetical protein